MKLKALFLITLLALCILNLPAQPLPSARADKMGFSRERLELLHEAIQGYVDQGKHAGIITLIARNGRVVDAHTYGYRDLEQRLPMQRDTIVRIYSMSKVLTSAAVMQLIEEGRITLNDPVTRYIPEFKDLKVCAGGTPDSPDLVPVQNVMTIKHLLTHTAGFVYDFSAAEPVKSLYAKADVLEVPTLKEFIARLATLPLAQQPGKAYLYGVNIDVLGYIIEVVSGKPLETYMQEKIFGPLGMKDSGFDVPPAKMPRFAKLYENGPDGKLREVAKAPYGSHPEQGRSFPSGGGGLFSTADDYARFGQMLLNGGKLDGKQILGRKTVELMLANHLTFLEKPFLGSPDAGFGLGGSVRLDLASANRLGSVGEFGWDGAATTFFRIDPKEKTIAILLAQHLPFNRHGIFGQFQTLFYAALVN